MIKRGISSVIFGVNSITLSNNKHMFQLLPDIVMQLIRSNLNMK